MRKYTKKSFPVEKVRRFLEPGPGILISSAWKGERNIMTCGWHMMMEYTQVGCFIWDQNHSHQMIRRSKQCVINVPTADLIKHRDRHRQLPRAGAWRRDRQVREVWADARSGGEGEGPADRRVLRELRVQADRHEPDQQVQPVRLRGRESARRDVAEISDDGALPRRRRVHGVGE